MNLAPYRKCVVALVSAVVSALAALLVQLSNPVIDWKPVAAAGIVGLLGALGVYQAPNQTPPVQLIGSTPLAAPAQQTPPGPAAGA